MDSKVNFFDYDRTSLEKFLLSLGEPSFRSRQILQWVYHRGVLDISEMTNLSLDLRYRLNDLVSFELPVIVEEKRSIDGTRKWLMKLSDGKNIEMVLIPADNRMTLCVSSQVGCALKCAFCATGQQGFSRNLTSSEIIGQVWLAERMLKDTNQQAGKITNVVMMGMGEPLLNYSAVLTAIKTMVDDLSFGLSRRRVTLSTAGIVPGIDRLAEDCPVSLAISLHASDDALRSRLVPLNKKYSISMLLDACRRYVRYDSRGAVTFEYIMLNGVNDSSSQAHQLRALLADLPAKVNLIPYNNVADTGFKSSSVETIEKFRTILNGAGIMTVTRKTRGSDIDAACGQLASKAFNQDSHFGGAGPSGDGAIQ